MKIHTLLLFSFLFQAFGINAQTHYFAYSNVINDTLKLRDTSLVSKIGPIDMPFKATSARCYVYQNNILVESDSTLHSGFSSISTKYKVLYPAGIGIQSYEFPPIKIFDLKNGKLWDEERQVGYILKNAPAPKPRKRKDGKLVYSFNDVCYVITDPKLSGSINPGVMWTGMQGGVVEIKTVHNKYELVFHAEDKSGFNNKEIDRLLQKLEDYQPKNTFVPYLYDTKPTAPPTGTFTPR